MTPVVTPAIAIASPTPAPTLRERAIKAEAALRSSQVDMEIDYGNGSRSSAHLRFDLGGTRLDITTIYRGAEAAQTIRRIVIGEQAWERRDSAAWTSGPAQESVAGQISSFLPHITLVPAASIREDAQKGVLRWYDAGRDADITLTVDPASGAPRQMRQVSRATRLVLTVSYSRWNEDVEITAP